MQLARGGLERPVVRDRDQGRELGRHEIHEAMLMVLQILSLAFSLGGA